jgi:hypothetical protein
VPSCSIDNTSWQEANLIINLIYKGKHDVLVNYCPLEFDVTSRHHVEILLS